MSTATRTTPQPEVFCRTLPCRVESPDTALPLVVPPATTSGVSLSLVIPTLNEAENIVSFLRAVHGELQTALGGSFEIVVVDDDSPDGTGSLAAALMPSLPRLRVLRRREERGLASAVIRGWQAARGELLATINADFQHSPRVLPALARLAAGADLVVASRYCAGGGDGDATVYRRALSKGARLIGHALAPEAFRRVTDPLSGCYAVHRRAIAGIEFRPSGYKTLIEILARGRVNTIAEHGYYFGRRRAGRSKASLEASWRYLQHLFRLRRVLRG